MPRIDPATQLAGVAWQRRSDAAGAVAAFETEFGQQLFRRAEAGKAALQQIETDKGGEGEEPLRNEDRASLDAERQGQKDEETRHDADAAFDGHA